MKFTAGWLKDHIDTQLSAKEIGDRLTTLGLELESIEDRAAVFAPFRVAYVESAQKHPDADRLKVLIVNTGKEKLQVVCGAPNARAGMKGIFAPDGSYIPGMGVTLKKGMIRGQESNGMMVSEREMGLSDDHDGIIDLDQNYEVGTLFADIYGLNDPVIDIAVTPNRADCAGVRGVARDLAASGAGILKTLKKTEVKSAYPCPVALNIDDRAGCPQFIGRHVRGVKNGPSPDWLQQRLKAIGLRPISALVDITNYLTFDLCRPLHIYDAAKISGSLTVREAKSGETLDALNGKSYTLSPGMNVICDEHKILALGGIMGVTASGAGEETTDIFIECAYFDPGRVARTGRMTGIISDARYRFERGIDPAFLEEAMEIATAMVLDLCGGEASGTVTAGTAPDWNRSYAFDPARTEKLTGVAIPETIQKEILNALGFSIEGNIAPYKVSPPSWRGDILGSADLIEEIIRVYGFDHIPALSVRCDDPVSVGAESDGFSRARKARTALAARGLLECVTWSFLKKETAALFGSNDNPALSLTNPISSELSHMRPSLLPNLVEAAQRNADRGAANAALFEVGPAFAGTDPGDQKTVAAGLRFAARGDRHWSGSDASRSVDALDAKADAIAALTAAGAPAANLQVSRDTPSYYHPGRSGALRLGSNVLAFFGELHPETLNAMGIKGTVAVFETFLGNIAAPKRKGFARPPLVLSQLQPVMRDFAFLLEDTIEAENLIRAARSADKMIGAIDIFDVYKGKGVEPGKKSVAINVTIHPKDKTLGEAEIDAISKKIVEAVTSKCGGSLRA